MVLRYTLCYEERRIGTLRSFLYPKDYPSHCACGDKAVRFITVKTSRSSSFLLAVSCAKDIISTLSSSPETCITYAQSAHKAIATAPATGFVTYEVYPDQPHQLSPLGSALGLMEDADTSSIISLVLDTFSSPLERRLRFLLMSFVRCCHALAFFPMDCRAEETQN